MSRHDSFLVAGLYLILVCPGGHHTPKVPLTSRQLDFIIAHLLEN